MAPMDPPRCCSNDAVPAVCTARTDGEKPGPRGVEGGGTREGAMRRLPGRHPRRGLTVCDILSTGETAGCGGRWDARTQQQPIVLATQLSLEETSHRASFRRRGRRLTSHHDASLIRVLV